jgi:hypothetical protein
MPEDLFEGSLNPTLWPSDVISTRHCLRIENECVRGKCSEFFYYISAVYLAPVVGRPAYDMFLEDMDAIVGSSR